MLNPPCSLEVERYYDASRLTNVGLLLPSSEESQRKSRGKGRRGNKKNNLPTESEYAAKYYQSFAHFGVTSRKIQEAPQAPAGGGPSSAMFDFRGFPPVR